MNDTLQTDAEVWVKYAYLRKPCSEVYIRQLAMPGN